MDANLVAALHFGASLSLSLAAFEVDRAAQTSRCAQKATFLNEKISPLTSLALALAIIVSY